MICLTFDTDWMTEPALRRFLDEFPIPGRATFFCHQPFDCLAASGHELCPHPFITDLNSWRSELEQLTERVNPKARGVRAHSCVFSHVMAVGLHDMGMEYVSQASQLYQDGIAPFRHPWGIWELPIYYMDNMDFWTPGNWPGRNHQPFAADWIRRAVHGTSLYVLDFHPVHIALNTRSPQDYTQVKSRIVDDGVSPFDLTFPGRGARQFFQELCAEMNAAGVRSVGCGEAIDAAGG
jgi:hypothetical protein